MMDLWIYLVTTLGFFLFVLSTLLSGLKQAASNRPLVTTPIRIGVRMVVFQLPAAFTHDYIVIRRQKRSDQCPKQPIGSHRCMG
ncbi:hypothetical protein F4802DRAFT_74390 [Xylaria palmicola]|nr:hypothetical protein F4802DRAFT_74390 [Xylaria palmicola]